MEWEKVWGSVDIGSIGMNSFLKYVHAKAFSCNIYACICVIYVKYMHILTYQWAKNSSHSSSNEHSGAQILVSNIITHQKYQDWAEEMQWTWSILYLLQSIQKCSKNVVDLSQGHMCQLEGTSTGPTWDKLKRKVIMDNKVLRTIGKNRVYVFILRTKR